MKVYKCELRLKNMSDWIQHISTVIKDIDQEDISAEYICTFNFEFDTILQ